MSLLKDSLSKVIDYFFPKFDINSKKLWKLISDYQKWKLILHDEICFVCKKESKNFQTHSFCNKNIIQLVSCFYYTNEIKKYILAFKYYHRKQIIEDIWYIMTLFYQIYFWNLKKEETIITFVPMHWFRKYFVKWYNQWELIAKQIWKNLDIKVEKICNKTKYTKPQAKIKERKKRLKNLQWSFKYNFSIPENVKNIIIVDDVITTWTTIIELASEIKKYNKKINIYSLILARK